MPVFEKSISDLELSVIVEMLLKSTPVSSFFQFMILGRQSLAHIHHQHILLRSKLQNLVLKMHHRSAMLRIVLGPDNFELPDGVLQMMQPLSLATTTRIPPR